MGYLVVLNTPRYEIVVDSNSYTLGTVPGSAIPHVEFYLSTSLRNGIKILRKLTGLIVKGHPLSFGNRLTSGPL